MTQFKTNDDDTDDLGVQYGREVLFEVMFVGNSAKVTAIDAETGVEVSIVAPPNTPKYSLKMNAMRKLMRKLGHVDSGEEETGPRWSRRPGRYA